MEEEDYYDDDQYVEIPCEFCNDPFPLLLLMEHQTGCRPDLARIIEPSVEEIEAEFLNLHATPKSEKKAEDPNINLNLNQFAEPSSEPKRDIIVQERSSKEPEKSVQKVKDIPIKKVEVLDEDLLKESETFSFHSTSQKEKRIEEEKPSFKFPPNSLINSDSRHVFKNDLTESDSEENECLEEFWKRADIKLAQRLKILEKTKSNSQRCIAGKISKN